MRERGRWGLVVVYALAMAWVEAATVLYLRTLVGRVDPYQANPLPEVGPWGHAELVRELATLVMIAAVGGLAGRGWRSRFGYACVAFGIWDIAYYAWLRILTGWPHSLVDWDLLFLLPLPWWGPVLAPGLIALLMVVGGTLLAWREGGGHPTWPCRLSLGAGALGVALALAVFMVDAARALPRGEAAIRQVLPVRFGWGWFLLACALMAVPVLDLWVQVFPPLGRRIERSQSAGAPRP
jgi:hypothetical protein